MPNGIPAHKEEIILAEALARPTLGARPLLEHLAERGVHRSGSGVHKVLRRWSRTGSACGRHDLGIWWVWMPSTSASSISLAGSWDGERWTIQRVPTPAGSKSSGLTSIDCARGTECYATGVYYQSSPIGLAFRAKWNGTAWSILPVPAP
jgi:hypothetical protein